MKIEAASQEKIDILLPWVNIILKALDTPEAFVTDESLISDFRPYWSKDIVSQKENQRWLQKISKSLELELEGKEYIIDIALKLKQRN